MEAAREISPGGAKACGADPPRVTSGIYRMVKNFRHSLCNLNVDLLG
jgi:hypothetical protein